MDENYITVKEVTLHNNCPECYSKGSLLLSFKQKTKETQFYKSITAEISHVMTCETCQNPIYPVQWTDDIERVVEYQQKSFTPMATSTYIKKTSWIIIALIFILGFIIGLTIALI